MAVESFWQHLPFNYQWSELQGQPKIEVQLDGSYSLRKLLLHQCYQAGTSVHAQPGNAIVQPAIRYWVDWYPAGGDARRIFRAEYRIPSVITTYTPAGGSQPAFFQSFTAGDHEIGFNQRYDHSQYTPGEAGLIRLTMYQEWFFSGSDTVSGIFLGYFSVLGQRKASG